MPPKSRPDLCNGAKNGPACFFARRLWQYDYKCKKCGILAPFTLATPTFNSWCIQCFYQHEDNKDEMCQHSGCKKALAQIQERIRNGDMDLSSLAEAPEIASTGEASSTRDDQAKNLVQTIQALKDEVAELKEKVRGMQVQIEALSARPGGQDQPWQEGEWGGWLGR